MRVSAGSTSVTRSPNSSSTATTSPRAMRFPFTSRSTGSPIARFSDTIEPGPIASVSPIVIVVRPISTESSTGTSRTGARSPEMSRPSPASSGSSATSSTGAGRSTANGSVCSSSRSVAAARTSEMFSLMTFLLDGDVGEVDVRDLLIGLETQILEDPLEQHVAAGAADERLRRRAGERVGDDGTDDVVLLGLHRARRLLRDRNRLLHLQRDGQLAVAPAGKVHDELRRELDELALDLRLGG